MGGSNREKKTITTPNTPHSCPCYCFPYELRVGWVRIGTVAPLWRKPERRDKVLAWFPCPSALLEWQLVRRRKYRSWYGKGPQDLSTELVREEAILEALWKSQDALPSGQDIQSLGCTPSSTSGR